MTTRNGHYSSKLVDLEERNECDTLVFGSLVKGLMKLGIWPGRLSPSEVHGSVLELMENLRSLHCFALKGRGKSPGSHADCIFTIKLTAEIAEIESNIMPTEVDDSHREHIKEQAHE
jgi:hypothetical protein